MSLNASLSIALQSLLAQDGALQATNNNIANVNTPGYSRQAVVLKEAIPTDQGGLGVGNGVILEGFQSVRDELLQMRIQQQTGAQSSNGAQLNSLQQIQPVFTTSAQDVGTQMTALFSSLSSLSADPNNSSLRQAVLASGANLAGAFNATSNALTGQQTILDAQVTQDVSQINQLTQQIAALNPQLAAMKIAGQDGGTVQDQRDQLVLSLSKLTDVSVTQTENGETLTTGSGTPLVVGSQSYALKAGTASDGFQHVFDFKGNDVTSSLKSGDLAGSMQTRDQTIPGILGQLDTLANQFATAFNAAQAKGYDQSGSAGQNFFTVPTAVAGSADAIRVALTSPSSIAASSDGSAGSNGNLVNFNAIQTNPLVAGQTPPGQTPTDTYANIVFQVGSLVANATAESGAVTASLLQLNDQRSAVSGVSIDEESTNLIRYQQAYEAAARVITTINTLFGVTVSMGTNAAA